MGRGTVRGSYGNCSRLGTKGREREHGSWNGAKQERVPGGVREAPGQVGMTQPAILALGQQRQTGHRVKVIVRDTG